MVREQGGHMVMIEFKVLNMHIMECVLEGDTMKEENLS